MLTLEVRCTGFPRPKISWEHDGIDIRPSTKFVFHEEAHDMYRLEIYQPCQKDSGLYVLRGVNDWGVVVYTHMVHFIEKPEPVPKHAHVPIVHRPSLLDRKEIERQREDAAMQAIRDAYKAKHEYMLLKGSGYGAPFHKDYSPTLEPHRLSFLGQLCDRIGLVGHNIRLAVAVFGPKPMIMWFLNGQPLREDEHITIKTVDNVSTVDILRMKLSLTGEYTCIATNLESDPSQIATSCYVRVYEARQKGDKVKPVFTLGIKGLLARRCTFSRK